MDSTDRCLGMPGEILLSVLARSNGRSMAQMPGLSRPGGALAGEDIKGGINASRALISPDAMAAAGI